MTISVSEQVLVAMGLQPLSPSRPLSATFHAIHVYQIRGFTLDAPSPQPISGTMAGVPYTLAVGLSVNEICLGIMQSAYADSEENWQGERNCSPPYLVVHVGPTTQHEANVSHAKEEERTITTYDRFSAAKVELKAAEDEILPLLISGLTCSFSSSTQAVRFIPTDRTVFGITPDGRILQDIRMTSSAQLWISSRLESKDIERGLASGVKLATEINSKVAHFFHLAINDDDPLKKFLYFFLAIEIETHAAFKKINHAKNVSVLITPPNRVAVSAHNFFSLQQQRWITLRDRFLWCALCVWTNLVDADVEELVRLKSIRDEIAHGSISKPPHWAVTAAEKLATKLQLASTSQNVSDAPKTGEPNEGN